MSSVAVLGANLKCCSERPPGAVRARAVGPYPRHAERATTERMRERPRRGRTMERLGTGIGWRPEIADAVEAMPGIDWVEAVAENL